MPLSRDPFSIIYEAFWDMVERHKPLAELVRHENRIRFDDDKIRDPLKEVISERDLPELRLITRGVSYHLQRTSNTSTLIQTYEWQVATGDQRFHKWIFPVNWELVRAMSKWQTALGSLTWSGQPLMLMLKPVEHIIGVTDVDMNRGIKGWSSLWTVQVELKFRTIDLQGD